MCLIAARLIRRKGCGRDWRDDYPAAAGAGGWHPATSRQRDRPDKAVWTQDAVIFDSASDRGSCERVPARSLRNCI